MRLFKSCTYSDNVWPLCITELQKIFSVCLELLYKNLNDDGHHAGGGKWPLLL